LPDVSSREKVFRCAFASGIDQRQFEAIRLNAADGLAHVLMTRGAVVLRHRLRTEVAAESAAMHELDVFGADLAVPLSARDGLVGVLLVGPRIAGADYSETELTLLYHLMEELGAGIRNAELHAHLFRERGMFSAVLRAVPVGCAVLSASLQIVHANRAFRSQLGLADTSPLRFEDLPQTWASAAYGVLQNRMPSASIEVDHEVAGTTRKIRVTVRPLDAEGHSDRSVFIALEDITAEIRARQEAEHASVHNLLQRAGEQLSNEFRNALTPVDIMVQLLRDPATGRNELERLGSQLSMAMYRLHRRIDDLAYLTRSAIIPEMCTVSSVLKDTRARLDNWLEPKQGKRVVWTNEFSEAALNVDRRAIALALAELVMNAVEASDGRQVTVAAEDSSDAVSFRVRNSGVWAPPPESSGFRHRPFISNKSTGVGLGVEVASRVAEHHGGRLILGPVSSDSVEAILRLPRDVPLFSHV
jgi:nitrogen fixation/metabolism regulation signal transduction histidine kinase